MDTKTIEECCDGECNHDDCCGKIPENCPHHQKPEPVSGGWDAVSKNPVADYEEIKVILYAFLMEYNDKNAEIRDEAIERATSAVEYLLSHQRKEILEKITVEKKLNPAEGTGSAKSYAMGWNACREATLANITKLMKDV